jgi:hypothetical protein
VISFHDAAHLRGRRRIAQAPAGAARANAPPRGHDRAGAKQPAYSVPADVDIEADARRIETFIADTNCLVLIGHGVATLGRTISEAYHRLPSFTSEVQRNIVAEELAAHQAH